MTDVDTLRFRGNSDDAVRAVKGLRGELGELKGMVAELHGALKDALDLDSRKGVQEAGQLRRGLEEIDVAAAEIKKSLTDAYGASSRGGVTEAGQMERALQKVGVEAGLTAKELKDAYGASSRGGITEAGQLERALKAVDVQAGLMKRELKDSYNTSSAAGVAQAKLLDHELNNVGTSGGKLRGILSGAFGAVATGAGAAVAGVVAVGVIVGKVGIDFLALKEQGQTAFETILGSASKARNLMGELQKFAAATPFEFPDLIRTSQTLLSMGFNAKQLLPMLTSVGDAMAAMGRSGAEVNSIALVFGQIQAKGRLMGDEMLQLAERGIPALKYLAEAAGVSTAEMQQQISKGMISSQQAISTILAGMEHDFAGSMQKQSLTFSGLLSTLKDNFSQFAGTLFEPLFPHLKTAMKSISDALQDPSIIAAIQGFGQAVVDGIGGAFDLAKQSYEKFGDDVQSAFAAVVQTVRNVATELAAVIAKHRADLETIGGVIRNVLGGAWDAFNDGAHLALGLIDNMLGPMADLAAGADTVAQKLGGWEPVIAGIVAVWATFKIGSIATSVVEAVTTMIGASRLLLTNWTAVTTTVEAENVAMATSTEAAATAMKLALLSTGIGAIIVGISAAIVLMITHWEETKKVAGEVADFVKEHWTLALAPFALWPAAIATVINEFGKIKGAFGAVLDWVEDRFHDVVQAIERIATKMALAIVEPLSHIPRALGGGVFQDIKASLKAHLEDLEDTGKKGGEKVAGAFTDALASAMKKTLGIVGQTIADALAQAYGLNPNRGNSGGRSSPDVPGSRGDVTGRSTPDVASGRYPSTVAQEGKGYVQPAVTLAGDHVARGGFLPAFPKGTSDAHDYMEPVGTVVRAPEAGKITRLSGAPGSGTPGGAGGLSLYFVGVSGTVYFMTHLLETVGVGSYAAGAPIAVVGPHASGSHVHVETSMDSGALAVAHQASNRTADNVLQTAGSDGTGPKTGDPYNYDELFGNDGTSTSTSTATAKAKKAVDPAIKALKDALAEAWKDVKLVPDEIKGRLEDEKTAMGKLLTGVVSDKDKAEFKAQLKELQAEIDRGVSFEKLRDTFQDGQKIVAGLLKDGLFPPGAAKRIQKEADEVAAAMKSALVDGVISPAELANVRKQFQQYEDALHSGFVAVGKEAKAAIAEMVKDGTLTPAQAAAASKAVKEFNDYLRKAWKDNRLDPDELKKLARLSENFDNLIDVAEIKRSIDPSMKKIGELFKQGFLSVEQYIEAQQIGARLKKLIDSAMKDGVVTDAEMKPIKAAWDSLGKIIDDAAQQALVNAKKLELLAPTVKPALDKLFALFHAGVISNDDFNRFIRIPAEIAAAWADGIITPAELAAINKDVDDLNSALEQGAKDLEANKQEWARIGPGIGAALKDGFLTPAEIAEIRKRGVNLKGAFKEVFDNALQAVDDAEQKFGALWADFKASILAYFDEVIKPKLRLQIDESNALLEMDRAVASINSAFQKLFGKDGPAFLIGQPITMADIEKQFAGVYAGLSATEKGIYAAGMKLVKATQDYWAVIADPNSTAAQRAAAAAALAQAGQDWQDLLDKIPPDDEDAQAFATGWGKIIDQVGTQGQNMSTAAVAAWEKLSDENKVAVGKVVDDVAQKLRDGSITWGEAVDTIAKALTDHGADAGAASQLLSAATLDPIKAAFGELKKAIDELKTVLGLIAGYFAGIAAPVKSASQTAADAATGPWEAVPGKLNGLLGPLAAWGANFTAILSGVGEKYTNLVNQINSGQIVSGGPVIEGNGGGSVALLDTGGAGGGPSGGKMPPPPIDPFQYGDIFGWQGGMVPDQFLERGGLSGFVRGLRSKGIDRVLAALTPGELVLNSGQQRRLSQTISGLAQRITGRAHKMGSKELFKMARGYLDGGYVEDTVQRLATGGFVDGAYHSIYGAVGDAAAANRLAVTNAGVIAGAGGVGYSPAPGYTTGEGTLPPGVASGSTIVGVAADGSVMFSDGTQVYGVSPDQANAAKQLTGVMPAVAGDAPAVGSDAWKAEHRTKLDEFYAAQAAANAPDPSINPTTLMMGLPQGRDPFSTFIRHQAWGGSLISGTGAPSGGGYQWSQDPALAGKMNDQMAAMFNFTWGLVKNMGGIAPYGNPHTAGGGASQGLIGDMNLNPFAILFPSTAKEAVQQWVRRYGSATDPLLRPAAGSVHGAVNAADRPGQAYEDWFNSGRGTLGYGVYPGPDYLFDDAAVSLFGDTSEARGNSLFHALPGESTLKPPPIYVTLVNGQMVAHNAWTGQPMDMSKMGLQPGQARDLGGGTMMANAPFSFSGMSQFERQYVVGEWLKTVGFLDSSGVPGKWTRALITDPITGAEWEFDPTQGEGGTPWWQDSGGGSAGGSMDGGGGGSASSSSGGGQDARDLRAAADAWKKAINWWDNDKPVERALGGFVGGLGPPLLDEVYLGPDDPLPPPGYRLSGEDDPSQAPLFRSRGVGAGVSQAIQYAATIAAAGIPSYRPSVAGAPRGFASMLGVSRTGHVRQPAAMRYAGRAQGGWQPQPGYRSGRGDVHVQINVAGSVLRDRELAETVRDEFVKIQRRGNSLFGEE